TNVDTQAAGSYAAWQMLEAAVTATKSLDDKVLAQWLRKNQVQTIGGRFRFDGPNNYGDDLSKVKQVQDGKWVVVWPKELAAPGTMSMTLRRKRPDGGPMFARPHNDLSRARARYVSDPIAMVVAETRAQAEDAADLVQIDYEPVPSVRATADATQPGAAPVWDECPDNISNIFESGDRAATEAAFAKAHRVVRRRYGIPPVHA